MSDTVPGITGMGCCKGRYIVALAGCALPCLTSLPYRHDENGTFDSLKQRNGDAAAGV